MNILAVVSASILAFVFVPDSLPPARVLFRRRLFRTSFLSGIVPLRHRSFAASFLSGIVQIGHCTIEAL
jgi:hypothetical protein